MVRARARTYKPSSGVSWPVVGAYILILLGGTYLLLTYQTLPVPRKPSQELGIPIEISIYVHRGISRFKFVNNTVARSVSQAAYSNRTLLQIEEAGLNISEIDARWVFQLEYPEAQEAPLIVNIISLQPEAAAEVREVLGAYSHRKTDEYANVSIYTAAVPSPPSGLGIPGPAVFALVGDDFLYAEGGMTALRRLKDTLEALMDPDARLDMSSFPHGVSVALSLEKPVVAISLTLFEVSSGSGLAMNAVKSVVSDGWRLLSVHVVSYETSEAAQTNMEPARSLFFTKEESVSGIDNMIVGVRAYELGDIRLALLSI